MKKYKIAFGEFTKFKEDKEFECFEYGTTQGIYSNNVECIEALNCELNYLKTKTPFYESVEALYESETEFKLKCVVKGGRKEIIHHYKIVDFSL